ncbi:uncharacterized protein LOC101847473 [Aplysia californica]|uniref:Uncharacterized protein LOC101847473 n=1 Tax=Aplysia californica TaxID=6500 RepID=A0ABM0JER6_APLCA|nr:uncharacterized protein LOC101847473 [Aplysia californica]
MACSLYVIAFVGLLAFTAAEDYSQYNPECVNGENTYMVPFPDLDDCVQKRYIMCFNERAVDLHQCADDLVFNSKLQYCDWATDDDKKKMASCTTVKKTVEVECKVSVFFTKANTTTCRSYQQCDNGRLLTQFCPRGFYYIEGYPQLCMFSVSQSLAKYRDQFDRCVAMDSWSKYPVASTTPGPQ